MVITYHVIYSREWQRDKGVTECIMKQHFWMGSFLPTHLSFPEPSEGQFSSVHAKCPESVPGERADQVVSLWQQHLHQGARAILLLKLTLGNWRCTACLIANEQNHGGFKLLCLCEDTRHSIRLLVILDEVAKCKISIFRLDYFPLATHHGSNLVYESCSDSFCFPF